MTELEFLTALLDRLAQHQISLRIEATESTVTMMFQKGRVDVSHMVDRAEMRASYAGAEWVLMDAVDKSIARVVQASTP